MEAYFPLYASFSVLCLVIKLFIVWKNRLLIFHHSPLAKTLLVCLFFINLLELTGFYYPSNGTHALFLMTIYYGFLLTTSATILLLALSLTDKYDRIFRFLAFGLLAISLVTLVTPGLVLKGVQSIGYTSSRVAGPYYWVFQFIFLSFIIASILSLAGTTFLCKDAQRRRKAKVLLISFSPIFIVCIGVVVLMQMGIRISASVVLSFAILFFLVTLLATENAAITEGEKDDQKLFRFLSYVPATSEFELANRVRHAVWTSRMNDLQGAITDYERTIIEECLALCQGNRTATAKALGISRTTLGRKLRNLNIATPDPSS